MTPNELSDSFKIIINTMRKYGFQESLNNLQERIAEALNNTTSSGRVVVNNSVRSSISQVVDNVFNSLNNSRMDIEMSLPRISKEINLEILLGENLDDFFNDFRRLSPENISNLNSALGSYRKEVTDFISLGDNIHRFIEVNDWPADDVNELVVTFEHAASVESLKDLSRVSSDWVLIVNAFSRLTRDNDSSVEIVSIKKGSLILTLAASSVIVSSICFSSSKILDLIMKIFEVRKKYLELKALNLDILADSLVVLEKASKLELDSNASKIVDQLFEEYGWKESDDTFHEVKKAVSLAIMKIIKFQNEGGKVDGKLLSTNDKEQTIVRELRSRNVEFKKVETEVHRLTNLKEILQLDESGKQLD